MSKSQDATPKPVEKRGGHPAGDKLVSDLKPPPPGPAPGAKPSNADPQKK